MKKLLFAIFFAVGLSVSTLSGNVFAEGTPVQPVLYQGMWSSNVTELQSDLKTLGYFYYNPTGYFGAHTTASVITYQKANNLISDGVVGSATQRELTNDMVIKKSKQYIGVPYQWGGTTPSGFDCSGFTQYVFRSNDVYIPRTSESQYNIGYPVSKSQLKQGDLVFFSTYKPGPSHVGIYIGNNQFIGASSSLGIAIIDLDNSYYQQRYIGARRVTG